MTASNTVSWPRKVWLDLQPGPGRLAAALRIVLATVIALVLMMWWRMPFASLALYFVFLVSREAPAVSFKTGLISMLTLTAAVAAELAVVVVSDNDPVVRLISVAAFSYLAGTVMMASNYAALGSIFGLIYCTLIGLWETHAPPDPLVKASLNLIASVGLAFLCTVLVEYLFAYRRPVDRLADQLKARFNALASVFGLFAEGAPPAQLGAAITGLNRLAATGQGPMQELYHVIAELDLDTAQLPVGLRSHITTLAELMDLAAAFASHHPEGVNADLRERCAEIARLCRERNAVTGALPVNQTASQPASQLARVEEVLHDLLSNSAKAAPAGEKDLVAIPSKSVPFMIAGAATSGATVAFALKLTLCVMACYIFYFSVGWPGISTSVTTVFIVALGHSGAIKQKLLNRLLGSAIGGALALGAAVFLFPLMDSITSLVVLISVVAFAAAWWAGGRQFGYAGLQIAFSFYLVAFEGFSAPTELTPPRDRMIGILVALAVVWLVFDQLWPVRTVTAMRRALAAVLQSEARFLRIFEGDSPHRQRLQDVDVLRDRMGKTIAGLRTMNDTVQYEFGVDRERQGRESAGILRAALAAVPLFWSQLAVLHRDDRRILEDPGLIAMRRTLAAQLDAMAKSLTGAGAFFPLGRDELAAPEVLASAEFGEYTGQTVEKFEDLQKLVRSLVVPDQAPVTRELA